MFFNITSTSRTNSPVFSSHIISIKKMNEFDNSTWDPEIGLWLSGLGYKSHFTTTAESFHIENR